MDEFTSSLLDPLETSTGDRHVFGESLDLLLDDAIDGEQKKVRNEIFKFKSKGYWVSWLKNAHRETAAKIYME